MPLFQSLQIPFFNCYKYPFFTCCIYPSSIVTNTLFSCCKYPFSIVTNTLFQLLQNTLFQLLPISFFICYKYPFSIVTNTLFQLAQWLRRPPRERKIRCSNPACGGIFPGSSHTSDFKIGTAVATLPGAGRYTVIAGTGRLGVSILRLCEVEILLCNFCLSVAAGKIVRADLSPRYTSMLLGR